MTDEPSARDDEIAETLADRDYWKSLGKPFGWRLFGFTNRYTAVFLDQDNISINLTAQIADALLSHGQRERARGMREPSEAEIEIAARAMCGADGKKPDDPRFIRYPSGDTFGTAWHGYIDRAEAALKAFVESRARETEGTAEPVSDPGKGKGREG